MYDEVYAPLMAKEIGVTFFRNKDRIRVAVPFAVEDWYKNYNMLLSEYPGGISKMHKAWSEMPNGPTKESLERKMILGVQKYFVSKMNIIKKQAKALIALDMGTKSLSVKQAHAIHEKIGLL